MLIEFSVSNFRSIRDEQRISMIATAAKEHDETHVNLESAPGVDRLLKSAVIYGANAAGKSNLLLAIDVMADIVMESGSDDEGKVLEKISPFCFDDDSAKPSKFEMVFIAEGIKYQYGFVANASRIFEEWLYAFPEKRSQEWFSRILDVETGAYSWKLGSHLKGQRSLWRDSTRPNALFLSTAVMLNAAQLLPAYQFFRRQLRIVPSGELNDAYSLRLLEDDEVRDRMANFLMAADTGVSGLSFRSRSPNPEKIKLYDMLPDGTTKNALIKKAETEVLVKHIGSDGKDVWLSMDFESRGTQKLFSFAGPILDVLINGYVFVVDELNNSFHPLIVKKLISIFHDNEINASGAQLIFTTHASSMLDFDIFRRDQIWFVEKDSLGASKVYPLTDFSPRKDSSLEKGYLLGKYGAIPFVSHGIF